jgi:hypothetical protein
MFLVVSSASREQNLVVCSSGSMRDLLAGMEHRLGGSHIRAPDTSQIPAVPGFAFGRLYPGVAMTYCVRIARSFSENGCVLYSADG